MNELHLFAGCGGGILGGMLLGHTTVCAVEIEPYCRKVLLQRQRDGILPRFPIWDDVTTFAGGPWRGSVDIVAGGFPCQDISSAGTGAGINGSRSGLWREFARIIHEAGPGIVFVENSPMLTVRGIGRVLWDLAEMGYDAKWGVLGASDAIWSIGDPCADHERYRIWIVAKASNSNRLRKLQSQGSEQDKRRWIGDIRKKVSDTVRIGREQVEQSVTAREAAKRAASEAEHRNKSRGRSWWSNEPGVGRVANGISNRVDRIRALGNAQVPIVAATAFRILTQ